MKKFWMLAALAALALGACQSPAAPGGFGEKDTDNNGGNTPKMCVDPNTDDCDNDGYVGKIYDCAPLDPKIYYGAPDLCGDNVDSDCNLEDGPVDKPCPQPDIDKPDFDKDGDPDETDCGPSDASRNKFADELCSNTVDDDCDGTVNENCGSTQTTCEILGWVDNDGDGYCAPPNSNSGLDCNDGDKSINPGAAEKCDNTVDDDCDDTVNEGCDTGGGSSIPPSTGNEEVIARITYSDAQPRTLNVRDFGAKVDFWKPWNGWFTSVTNTVEGKFMIDGSACGLRLNVTEGLCQTGENCQDKQTWLAMGNSKTPQFGGAFLDTDATITVTFKGKTYTTSGGKTTSEIKVVSDPLCDWPKNLEHCGSSAAVLFNTALACDPTTN